MENGTANYYDAVEYGKFVHVFERDADGKRKVVKYPKKYVLYYNDEEGDHMSITGDTVSRFETDDFDEFQKARSFLTKRNVMIHEDDIMALNRVLEEHYLGRDVPRFNIGFLDIEVDRDPSRSFARPNDPYAPITAFSFHSSFEGRTEVFIMPPPGVSVDEFRNRLARGNDRFPPLTGENGYHVLESEFDILAALVSKIEKVDIVTGWNINFFDIPYIVQRLRIVAGGESIMDVKNDYLEASYDRISRSGKEALYYLGGIEKLPKLRRVFNYGRNENVYRPYGKAYLDYLELYKKFTYSEQPSYSLDHILGVEIDQEKVKYEGTLDRLYREDPVTFAAYSFQDVEGLVQLDRKLGFIGIANEMAHTAACLPEDALGSVKIIDMSLTVEAHRMNKVVPGKSYAIEFLKRPMDIDTIIHVMDDWDGNRVVVERDKHVPVLPVPSIPGGYVLVPKPDIYEWIASYDFNSLYPTVMRMLNISPETVVGNVIPVYTMAEIEEEVEKFADKKINWSQIWGKYIGTKEYNMIIEGTDDPIPIYWVKQKNGLMEEDTTEIVSARELKQLIMDAGCCLTAFGLVIDMEKDGLIPYCLTKWYNQRKEYKSKAKEIWKRKQETEDETEKERLQVEYEYWDKRQLVQKFFLNSTYGAFLNEGFRYNNRYLGASVTMSGRICLSEMVNEIEEVLDKENLLEIGRDS